MLCLYVYLYIVCIIYIKCKGFIYQNWYFVLFRNIEMFLNSGLEMSCVNVLIFVWTSAESHSVSFTCILLYCSNFLLNKHILISAFPQSIKWFNKKMPIWVSWSLATLIFWVHQTLCSQLIVLDLDRFMLYHVYVIFHYLRFKISQKTSSDNGASRHAHERVGDCAVIGGVSFRNGINSFTVQWSVQGQTKHTWPRSDVDESTCCRWVVFGRLFLTLCCSKRATEEVWHSYVGDSLTSLPVLSARLQTLKFEAYITHSRSTA